MTPQPWTNGRVTQGNGAEIRYINARGVDPRCRETEDDADERELDEDHEEDTDDTMGRRARVGRGEARIRHRRSRRLWAVMRLASEVPACLFWPYADASCLRRGSSLDHQRWTLEGVLHSQQSEERCSPRVGGDLAQEWQTRGVLYK